MGKNFLSLYTVVLILLFSHLSFSQQTETVEKLDFATAKGIFDDGLFKLAADQFTAFISKYPQSNLISQAKFYLAESYFQLKDYQKAGDYFEQLLKSDIALQSKPLVKLRYGECFFYLKKYFLLL